MACQFSRPQTHAMGMAASSASMGTPVKMATAARWVADLGSGSNSEIGARRTGCSFCSAGVTDTSVVAVITVPRWLEGAGQESDPHNRGHGQSEYAYVTVAYGSVGFPRPHRAISDRLRPLRLVTFRSTCPIVPRSCKEVQCATLRLAPAEAGSPH